jgi:amidophosphoribosyltransferase
MFYPKSDDGPREACGVFGIYAPGADVARLTFFAQYALQHRGQESAGIAVSDGQTARLHKAMGLVSQVFTEDNLRPLHGHIAIGHNRYSTKGSSRVDNAQPFLLESVLGPLGLAHNGNLVNSAELRQDLLRRGVGLMSSSDSEVIAQMLAGAPGNNWVERIRLFMVRARGAYSLTILTRDTLYAVRDPWGIRPLCLGQYPGGWAVASESCALTTIGATFVREIEPGEIVAIDGDGVRSVQGAPPSRRALCAFEYIYFARPDSILQGRLIHVVRQELGARVAAEHAMDADWVMGIPDSATAAAIGYARSAHLPFSEGLIKNRYIGRTFIQPDDRLRRLGVALKFNALGDNLKGKRIIVVDDSIVRGNTSGPIIALLRAAGAAEVHLRVTSPPIRHPCYMGVDMATHQELIAHRMSIPEIRDHLGVDTLGYLSIEGLAETIGQPSNHLCMACFSGDYPMSVDAREGEKLAFDGVIHGGSL